MNYPPANVWTKVEIEAEPEPELVAMVIGIQQSDGVVALPANLRLPAAWSPERRAGFVQRWRSTTDGQVRRLA